ncbi:MAG: fluoride efflux transporter CrcB [Dehalococcoidia bacterium]
MNYIWVMAGAMVGAPLRYFVGTHFPGGTSTWGSLPIGTYFVNVTGCLLIGLVLGYAEARDTLPRETRLLLVTGFLGSYTTFSAFGYEIYDLARSDDVAWAVAYVALSLVAGVLAAWAGSSLARAIF